ncbi:MAG: hypothetical protein JXX29_11120 [Deltaproteobacteria bacterium]|nr:hypothetical protein [Deltaproteobacteria bacterium]MBN2672221.1 hypothetical protein [Deltaproteobacteria bacterium]
MKHRICTLSILVWMCVLLGACQEEMESRSFISKFRLLGIQSNPAEAAAGDYVEVRGIFAPVEGQSASVAWVLMDTQQIAALDDMLPDDIDQYTDEQLAAWLASIMSEDTDGSVQNAMLSEPAYRVIVSPVDALSGIAVLPSQHVEISSSLVLLMRAFGQAEGVPLYMLACSNGEIDEAALQRIISNLSDTQELGELESACVGEESAAIAAYKTLNLYIPAASEYDALSTPNQNPVVDTFQIDEISHAQGTEPGETGSVLCEGKEGCRDPVTFRVSLTKSSYEYYQGYDRRRNEMEKTFVSWFSNGGEFAGSRIRSNDAQFAVNAMEDGDEARLDARLADENESHWFEVEWMPPVEGGVFDLWIVANDLRGGVGHARYLIRADAPNY